MPVRNTVAANQQPGANFKVSAGRISEIQFSHLQCGKQTPGTELGPLHLSNGTHVGSCSIWEKVSDFFQTKFEYTNFNNHNIHVIFKVQEFCNCDLSFLSTSCAESFQIDFPFMSVWKQACSWCQDGIGDIAQKRGQGPNPPCKHYYYILFKNIY